MFFDALLALPYIVFYSMVVVIIIGIIRTVAEPVWKAYKPRHVVIENGKPVVRKWEQITVIPVWLITVVEANKKPNTNHIFVHESGTYMASYHRNCNEYDIYELGA